MIADMKTGDKNKVGSEHAKRIAWVASLDDEGLEQLLYFAKIGAREALAESKGIGPGSDEYRYMCHSVIDKLKEIGIGS